MKFFPTPKAACAAVFAIMAVASSVSSVRAEAGPAFSIDRVLALANMTLAQRHEPDVFIKSIALSKPTLLGGKEVWVVTWSRALPASKPGLQEIGLSVSMDGRAVRVVK